MKQIYRWIYLIILFGAWSFAFGADQVSENIVKIYTTSNEHSYSNPWQMEGPENREGSGCIIEGNRILTNAHVVSDQTFIRVKRSGQTKKYIVKVRYVAHECDLAILEVKDQSFFPDLPPLEVGLLPMIMDEVSVYGYPSGAEQLTITKGIVSRVSHEKYAHSFIDLLCCQIDAPINYGNSGGPVIADGKIAGIAMMAGWGENEGYMVSVPVIKHFLEDIRDGIYDGIPSLGISCQNMENPSMRRFYKMEDEKTGVLVRKVFPGSPAQDILIPGDVILSIDGKDIANDGTIQFRGEERTSFSYVIQNRYFGDTLGMQVLREGAVSDCRVLLTATAASWRLVPFEQFDVKPAYYIYGGFIFSPLTGNLIMEFEDDWWDSAPLNYLYSARYRDPTETQKEVVVIVDMLADEINIGYEDLYYEIVSSVNGKKIGSIGDLVIAIESNRGPYHVIDTEDGKQIILDRKQANRSTRRILKLYRIKRDRSENLRMR